MKAKNAEAEARKVKEDARNKALADCEQTKILWKRTGKTVIPTRAPTLPNWWVKAPEGGGRFIVSLLCKIVLLLVLA